MSHKADHSDYCPTDAIYRLLCVWLILAFATSVGCTERNSDPSPSKHSSSDRLATETMTRHNRGIAQMGRFDYAAAHEIFSKLHEENPTWLGLQIDLAIATLNRRQQGDIEQAASLLEDVIQRDPGSLRAPFCRGLLYLNGGDPENALALFLRVAQEDASDAYVQYYAGQCLFELGKLEEALTRFERAQQLDPYLRSAYYGAFQVAQRLRQREKAMEYLEFFQRLDDNPQARLAEIKYTRMGPKAEVQAYQVESEPRKIPTGELFLPGRKIGQWSDVVWSQPGSGDRSSISVCDIDGDGDLDCFTTRVVPDGEEKISVVLERSADGLLPNQEHALSGISDVHAALWGDYDNDGRTDVYLCRSGANQLWENSESGWRDVTSKSMTSGASRNTVDGAMFDADHDGDLDLMLINADGPNDLLSNNRDGTFRSLADQGIGGDGSSSRQVVLGDFDHDRDVDLIVINDQPPHEAYSNDRLWDYTNTKGMEAFQTSNHQAVAVADSDADGQLELYSFSAAGLRRWSPNVDGVWGATPVDVPIDGSPSDVSLAFADADGDGRLDLFVFSALEWLVWDLGSRDTIFRTSVANVSCYGIVNTESNGPAVIGVPHEGVPMIWEPGPGRFEYALISFTGKDDQAEQMRTNISGIGVRSAIRIGHQWTVLPGYRLDSGPGQSFQPCAVGTRGADAIDFVSIYWPDGLFQSEVDLPTGKTHRISEIQRQVSSCPVVFAWDGTNFRFVTDVLGVGGLGYNLGLGEYAPPRPHENLLLPPSLLEPREDEMRLVITEPMEEACYLDAARLVAYDLPPGWQMTIDERFAVDGNDPSGTPVFFRREIKVAHAHLSNGMDVTGRVAQVDGDAVPAAARDHRFIGRTKTQQLTLQLDRSLEHPAGHENQSRPFLWFHGWVEYPYSQTMFAAWQAGAEFKAPTLEAKGADGQWRVILSQFGYMAGMPRESTVPIPIERLPEQTRWLRLTTNQEIYWDRISIVWVEGCPDAKRHVATLSSAELSEIGFPLRTTDPQMKPNYDYTQRTPFWDVHHQAGWYTTFGNVRPLLDKVDDAVVIFGPGEAVELAFDVPFVELPDLWTRRWVLETNGWCKDMDLFTQHGETVEPLPRRRQSDAGAATDELHERFQLRYRDGL